MAEQGNELDERGGEGLLIGTAALTGREDAVLAAFILGRCAFGGLSSARLDANIFRPEHI
ncbi:MAG TPA: hypothetical protein VFF42_02740 [Candidatus Eremiobacteraceae bacterium]|nr:hypothetical protein [Candidatus Eremiobacteraceae bacterium]